MYTLKGIFPEPKKEQKKNFIRENMKQLKLIQGNKSPKEPKYTMKAVHPPRLTNPIAAGSSLGQVKSSPSTKSGKISLAVGKTSSTNARKKVPDIKIMKGDMAEFLKRKEMRQPKNAENDEEDEVRSAESTGRLRDIACQTIESNLAQNFTDNAKLTVLYPKNEEKLKACGDTAQPRGAAPTHTPRRAGDAAPAHTPRRAGDAAPAHTPRRAGDAAPGLARLNAILDRKDPALPAGQQKGSQQCARGGGAEECPGGHVALPDNERKETLRMLRNSFAELVSELNKLPVKTDTLRMRARKLELERQLARLEDGIKVFSRPRVYVKLGE